MSGLAIAHVARKAFAKETSDTTQRRRDEPAIPKDHKKKKADLIFHLQTLVQPQFFQPKFLYDGEAVGFAHPHLGQQLGAHSEVSDRLVSADGFLKSSSSESDCETMLSQQWAQETSLSCALGGLTRQSPRRESLTSKELVMRLRFCPGLSVTSMSSLLAEDTET